MKKAIKSIALILLLSPLAVSAQNQKMAGMTPEQKADRVTDVMKTRLKLNDKQTTKVRAINQKYAPQIIEANKSNPDKAAKFIAIRKIATQRDNELKPILTEAQYTQYIQMENQRLDKVENGRTVQRVKATK